MRKLSLILFLIFCTSGCISAWATVPSATPLFSQYSCNSSTTQWPYTFQISATSDMQVYVNDNLGTITQEATSTYSVDTSNVWVNYPLMGSPCPTGSTITLVPATPQTQLLSLTSRSPFVATAIGSALDKLTLISQQLQGQLNRAVLAPAGTTAFTFPSSVPNNLLGWDPAGSGNIVNFLPNTGAYLAIATTSDAQTGINNTKYMTPALVATEVNFPSSSAILIPASNLAGSIPDSKLNTISTAGKISGAALTSLASVPSGAGVIPSANLPTYPNFVPNNVQVFTSTGTWTKPAGVSKVYVKVIGAGGAGATGSTGGAGGGGGGGYAEGIISVTGNVTVTIGATNSFAGTTTIQATAGSNASGSSGGAGGVGSIGTINLTGAAGQGGNGLGNQNSMGGSGGGSAFGPGGGGGAWANGVGGNGGAYGGGGGGGGNGASSAAGGTGDVGAVIVYY